MGGDGEKRTKQNQCESEVTIATGNSNGGSELKGGSIVPGGALKNEGECPTKTVSQQSYVKQARNQDSRALGNRD